MPVSIRSAAFAVVLCAAGSAAGLARQILQPPFDAHYSVVDLGQAPNVPGPLGGLHVDPANADTLLLGGRANNADGAVWAVPLTRTCGKISGFAGASVRRSDAPTIDGGLVFAPNAAMLFTRYSNNHLGQTRPGSTLMDKSVDLAPFGIVSSVGTCQFVPPGFPGAGQFKIVSYSASQWHTLQLIPDGTGLFDVGAVSPPLQIVGGPEGVVYIRAGSPQFPTDSVLVTEFGTGSVAAYEIDSNGDPLLATHRVFLTGLGGAEGAHIDRVTGDFLFSTFTGGDRIVLVRGFSALCAGDTNNDNRVDFADLNTVLSNYGQSAPGIPGDVNNDCSVTFADLNIVLGRYGIVCPS